MCLACGDEWDEELPWLGDIEEWPACCNQAARLMQIVGGERIIEVNLEPT